MRRIDLRQLIRLSVAIALSFAAAAGPPLPHNLSASAMALEQVGDAPPDVGPLILTNPTLPGFPTVVCPTGRNRGEPVGEGYILKVTGRAREGDPGAAFGADLVDVMFPDGELRLDVKVVTGGDRATFIVGFRDQRQPGHAHRDSYDASITPSLGLATLDRSGANLVVRQDLSTAFSADSWNTIAIRAMGADIWLLVNGQVAAQASDSTFDRGKIWLDLVRLGDLDDTAEAAAVVRNLQISRLAVGDPGRAPTLLQSGQSPSPAPKPPSPEAAPAGTLWADNFDDPASLACTSGGVTPVYEVGCIDGEFRLVLRDPTVADAVRVTPAQIGRYANAALTADARLVGGFEQRGIGVGCRDQGLDHKQNYHFVIAPATGEAAVFRLRDDGLDNLTGWQPAEVIRRAGEKNRLSILCSGSTIRGLVNDVEVVSAQASTYPTGAMFFYVYRNEAPVQAEGRFDNAVVTELP